MTEMNARTLMFNLGPIDSTTLVKIARYADRKQLTYKITKKGTLLLDGRGKKIHLKNGVVTLRNALGLHALPERKIDDHEWLQRVRYVQTSAPVKFERSTCSATL